MANPSFHPYWLSIGINQSNPFYELGIVGEKCLEVQIKLSQMFLPNIVLFGGEKENSLELLKDRIVAGKTLFYVCEKGLCHLPIENLEDAVKKLLN